MEFKQLEAFVAVVENKSFSEAARQLNLTQPTISAHINSLEQELNSRLLIRTTKKLTITQRGLQLYDCASNMPSRTLATAPRLSDCQEWKYTSVIWLVKALRISGKR